MLTESMKFTLRILLRKPVRSLLTVLQVSLGIAAVVLVLNVLMQPEEATEGPSFIGSDEQIIEVQNGQETEEPGGGRSVRLEPIFTPDDLRAVRELDGVVSVPVKQYDFRDTIELNGMRYLTSGLRLVNKDLMDIANPPVVEGTSFSAVDFQGQSRALIISRQAAAALFGDESPIGQTLVLTRHTTGTMRFDGLGQEFEIIGVVDIAGAEMMPFNLRPEHFMAPLGEETLSEASESRLGPTTLLHQFTVIVKKSAVDSVKRSLEELFSARYGSRATLLFTEPYIPSASRVDRGFGLFLGAFALVGLIVSSIGILSIMMVSTVERTHEIGLRRAIGASRRAVVIEILMEAGVLAALGACTGLVAAWFIADPLSGLLTSTYASNPVESLRTISLQAALSSLGLSVVVGILAGLLPAIQASRRSPVDSLRDLTS